jgi:hypothetical protein
MCAIVLKSTDGRKKRRGCCVLWHRKVPLAGKKNRKGARRKRQARPGEIGDQGIAHEGHDV